MLDDDESSIPEDATPEMAKHVFRTSVRARIIRSFKHLMIGTTVVGWFAISFDIGVWLLVLWLPYSLWRLWMIIMASKTVDIRADAYVEKFIQDRAMAINNAKKS